MIKEVALFPARCEMKNILGIVMMFSLMGLLSVMAQEVKPKQTDVVDLGKGVKLEMALIPAGKFIMGSLETEKNRGEDEIQHEVTITKPFYIGKYEVTQEQWQAVMGNNPSEVKGAKLPLTNVSWGMSQDFIKKLNDKTNGGFRLPTEAEWEYACRGGKSTAYYFGNEVTPKDVNYGASNLGKTVPVASKKANVFGLHEMHGNGVRIGMGFILRAQSKIRRGLKMDLADALVVDLSLMPNRMLVPPTGTQCRRLPETVTSAFV